MEQKEQESQPPAAGDDTPSESSSQIWARHDARLKSLGCVPDMRPYRKEHGPTSCLPMMPPPAKAENTKPVSSTSLTNRRDKNPLPTPVDPNWWEKLNDKLDRLIFEALSNPRQTK